MVRLGGRALAHRDLQHRDFNVLGTLYAIDDTCPHAARRCPTASWTVEPCSVRACLRFDLLGCVHTSRSFGVRCYIIEIRGDQPIWYSKQRRVRHDAGALGDSIANAATRVRQLAPGC